MIMMDTSSDSGDELVRRRLLNLEQEHAQLLQAGNEQVGGTAELALTEPLTKKVHSLLLVVQSLQKTHTYSY